MNKREYENLKIGDFVLFHDHFIERIFNVKVIDKKDGGIVITLTPNLEPELQVTARGPYRRFEVAK